MNFPFLKHPKSARSFHPTNNNLEGDQVANEQKIKQQIEHTQEEFLSIASHELRTPLTAIKGNVSLIKQYFWEQIPGGELRGMIDDIDQASTRMIKLVNNVLDTLRIEQRLVKFDAKKLDIVALVKEVVAGYQAANLNRELLIILNEPSSALNSISTDPLWTKNLINYFLDNAVKYTERGTITVAFSQEADFIKIFISDTGHGIALESQKSVFKKFAQVNENILTRDTVQGTGLGLYLSKLVAESMQGDVHLESSELGRGSTFSVRLPISKSR
jgi:signal transduction histidine kinase